MAAPLRGLWMLCAVALAPLVPAGCSPATNHWALMRTLNANLSTQPHECVPLGWNPVPFDGKHFTPGQSIEEPDEGAWLPAIWIGQLHKERSGAQMRAIGEVLDALVRSGIVVRRGFGAHYRYHLTEASLPYFYDENRYGNNPGHLPYLCYSFIEPSKVLWSGPLHRANNADPHEVFGAEFAWQPTPYASWAQDPVIRRHGVVLAPGTSPLLARVGRWGREWHVEQMYPAPSSIPTVVDVRAWPR